MGEEDEAFAVAPIDLDLALIEEGGVFSPTPADADVVAIPLRGNDRLNGGEIR